MAASCRSLHASSHQSRGAWAYESVSRGNVPGRRRAGVTKSHGDRCLVPVRGDTRRATPPRPCGMAREFGRFVMPSLASVFLFLAVLGGIGVLLQGVGALVGLGGDHEVGGDSMDHDL